MKLKFGRTLLVGTAFLAISSFWSLYDGIVPLILKNTFALNDTLAGFIMALDNILALFMLPLFGSLSDKLKTPLGRRTPFIIGGTAVAVVSMLMIPVAARIHSLTLMMVSLGITLFAMGTYRSPAVALMPDVTPKPLRSKANAIINLMGTFGGIMALGLIAALVPKGDNPNYLPVFSSVAAIMVAAVVVLVATIRENKLRVPDDPEEAEEEAANAPLSPEKRTSLLLILASVFLWFAGYNAVTTAFSKYANIRWGLEGGAFAYTLMVAQAAAAIAFLPVGVLSGKLGRRKVILLGVGLLTLVFASAALFKQFHVSMFVLFALAGVAWAAINVNSFPMVVELSRGSNIGKYTGYYYTASMAAQIITPIVSGALLEYAGYWTLFPYGAFFVALSFITMLFVRHGDSKPVKKVFFEEYAEMDT